MLGLREVARLRAQRPRTGKPRLLGRDVPNAYPNRLSAPDNVIVKASATPAQMATAMYGSSSVSAQRWVWPPRGSSAMNTAAVTISTTMPEISRIIDHSPPEFALY